jgi:uncharacterized protein (TIGR03032 family)
MLWAVNGPLFVVAPPQSGAKLLSKTLSRADGLTPAEGRLPLPQRPDSDRLDAGDLSGAVEPPESGLLVSDGRDALRVPLLAEAFPDARFVYVHRDPGSSLPAMVAAWESGNFVTHPDLEGWPGPPWSLPLVPEWQELAGRELAEIVAHQWTRSARILFDDLEALPPERWSVIDLRAFVAHPERELQRLCDHIGVEWNERLSVPLPTDGELMELSQERMRVHGPNLQVMIQLTKEQAERASQWVAQPRGARVAHPDKDSPLRSVHTSGFPGLLRQLASSILVSTYQTGKLICLRERDARLNTHFRDFDRPMGLAVRRERVVVGTRAEVIDLRDMPEAAAKIDPPGSHDACYLPRNRHFTGDIRIHDVAFAAGELWLVATEFSCLATLDATHSFVPRWAPPFITKLAPGDRCHLNGLCVIDDVPRYVTALGETDEPGGWRPGKADGGVLIDVQSSELVLRGLSMPHSPRWHDGRMWLLESGKGELVVADLDAGTWETVAELPGFTRGLTFAGPFAFIGLSKIRETVTFGGLPITERLEERLCGVWVVDTRSGQISAFVRFEDLVQEIYEVALMPGVRFPDIVEPNSETALQSFQLPA